MPETKDGVKKSRARRPVKEAPEVLAVHVPTQKTLSGAFVGPERAWMWSAIYRAWSIISQSIASLTIELRRREIANGRIRRPLVIDHPIYSMLEESPNSEQTPYIFKETIGGSLVRYGNFYAVIQRTSRNANTTAIWPLQPQFVQVERRQKTDEILYHYDSQGGRTTYSAEDIVHVPLFGDGIVGKSPIALARQTIGLALATEAAGASLFGNGMMPSGILTHPGRLNAEARKNIEEYFERHIGMGQNRRTVVIQEGMKYDQLGIPPEDAQFLQTRDFQVAEIGRWYGVPPHMLGEVKDSKYASITPLQIEFVVYTLKHYALRIAQELTRKLFPPGSGYFLRFDIDDLMRGDPDTQAKYLRELWGMGVYTVNEIREKLDEDDIGEEGDKRAVPVNFTTLDRLGEESAGQIFDEGTGRPTGTPAGPGDGGDQATPENGAPRAGMQIVFRDAAGRLLRHELSVLRKLVAKHDAMPDLDDAVRAMFREHEEYVRRTLGPVWRGLGALLSRSVDIDKGASTYVSEVRELVLVSLRNGGRDTLLRVMDAWEESRADAVTAQYMEAAILN